MHTEPFRVNSDVISRKGTSCLHIGIAEVDVETNSAARERGDIAATLCNRNDAVGAAFKSRAREAERRRAQGGLVLVNAPLGLCCTGGGDDDEEEPEDAGDEGEGDAEKSSWIEDELTRAGDGDVT